MDSNFLMRTMMKKMRGIMYLFFIDSRDACNSFMYIFFVNFFASSIEIDQFLQFHHSEPSTMVFETRKASNTPRKRRSTIKTRENNEKTSKPSAKRVKSKSFIHSNKISKESTPESRSS